MKRISSREYSWSGCLSLRCCCTFSTSSSSSLPWMSSPQGQRSAVFMDRSWHPAVEGGRDLQLVGHRARALLGQVGDGARQRRLVGGAGVPVAAAVDDGVDDQQGHLDLVLA